MKFIAGLVGLIVSASCFAGSIEYEAVDFKNCTEWFISPAIGINPKVDPIGHEAFLKAEAIFSQMPHIKDRESWQIYLAYDYLRANIPTKFAACRWNRDGLEFECSSGFDYPISGARFAQINGLTFSCISGCEKIGVKMFHNVGSDLEGRSNDHNRQLRKLKRVCAKKERR